MYKYGFVNETVSNTAELRKGNLPFQLVENRRFLQGLKGLCKAFIEI